MKSTFSKQENEGDGKEFLRREFDYLAEYKDNHYMTRSIVRDREGRKADRNSVGKDRSHHLVK